MSEKVIESWKLVTAIDNYEEVAGLLLFRKIFTIAPEAQGLFKFLKKYEPFDPEMFDNPMLKKHAKGVIATVNAAVGMLESGDMETLVQVLKDLGAKHVNYGVLKEHYAIVGEALIGTLNNALGDQFDADVKAAWEEIYGVISSTMIEGAAY